MMLPGKAKNQNAQKSRDAEKRGEEEQTMARHRGTLALTDVQSKEDL